MLVLVYSCENTIVGNHMSLLNYIFTEGPRQSFSHFLKSKIQYMKRVKFMFIGL